KLSLDAGVTAAAGDYAGKHGTLHIESDGSFTYTLTENMDSGAVGGANKVTGVESFDITITDADGNTAKDTIKVDVIDDVPTANADTGAANSGAKITGDVEANDVFGADGKSGSGVVGVAKGTDTSTPVSGSTGTNIAGDYGTLKLNVDGSYEYHAKVNADL